MRVTLLNPVIINGTGLEELMLVEPLGLECIASVLEADGHTCRIVDMRLDGMPKGMAKVSASDPEIIGVQSAFTSQRPRTLHTISELRRCFPDVPIIVGGHDASMDPEWLDGSGFSALVRGPGETTMRRLVQVCETGGDPTEVPGLVVNNGGSLIDTGPAPADDSLEDMPFPARHLIKDYARHYCVGFFRPVGLLETSRGCPHRCNFCTVWKFHQGRCLTKPTETVIRELQGIAARYVFIIDDNFGLDARYTMGLAEAIQERKIRKNYVTETRSDIVCKHPDLFKRWKEAGLLYLFLGVETINDEELRALGKGNTVGNNEEAIEILSDLDVGYALNFIIDPGWDHDDFARLREWMERVNGYMSFSVLTPLPGAKTWEEVKDRLTTRDWGMYDFEHSVLPTKLPLEEFYEEFARLWRHSFDIRLRANGFIRTYSRVVAALGQRRATLGWMYRSTLAGRALSDPKTFLAAHQGTDTSVGSQQP